ncbi:hypothetical protein [Anaerotignum faecicola]|uniref:hypothetical protein n=1 Tax=Anaerotignum faecicola TaxID=2358141 RepID=UPI000F6251E5|nr:hypothetical protein [Anaerotignum faecicola]
MEVKFIKASPTENMTLLIETPVAREKQLAVAERLIAYGSVYAEQAISRKRKILRQKNACK